MKKNLTITICIFILAACQSFVPSPTSTPQPTDTPIPTSTSTLTPTPTKTPIPPTPTLTPIPPTSTPILPTPDIAFRRIGLNELKGNSLIFDIPIELDIPKEYVSINNGYTDYTEYVWMPKKYAGSYQGIASVEADFLDVTTSVGFGYDGTTNTFIGIPHTDQEKKNFEKELGGTITLLEQSKVGEFPIVVFEISNLPADEYSGFTKINFLLIGTTVGTMTIMIKSLSSPENFVRNEFVWARLKASLSIRE